MINTKQTYSLITSKMIWDTCLQLMLQCWPTTTYITAFYSKDITQRQREHLHRSVHPYTIILHFNCKTQNIRRLYGMSSLSMLKVNMNHPVSSMCHINLQIIYTSSVWSQATNQINKHIYRTQRSVCQSHTHPWKWANLQKYHKHLSLDCSVHSMLCWMLHK